MHENNGSCTHFLRINYFENYFENLRRKFTYPCSGAMNNHGASQVINSQSYYCKVSTITLYLHLFNNFNNYILLIILCSKLDGVRYQNYIIESKWKKNIVLNLSVRQAL